VGYVVLSPGGERVNVGKIVAAGANYADHIEEMKMKRPPEPVLFLKPASAIIHEGEPIFFPSVGTLLHHEVELGLLITRTTKDVSPDAAESRIGSYLLALDLTLRDLQDEAKKLGRPWSTSKGFDCSCPVSEAFLVRDYDSLELLPISLSVNGETRQESSTANMLWRPAELVAVASRYFTLEPGDLVLTGTPAGVGPLERGDRVEARLGDEIAIGFDVV
jgi:acylpyruvate hydrolase